MLHQKKIPPPFTDTEINHLPSVSLKGENRYIEKERKKFFLWGKRLSALFDRLPGIRRVLVSYYTRSNWSVG